MVAPNRLGSRSPIVELLNISLIRRDGGTQHRIAHVASVVEEYAQLMIEGVVFPPIRVWWDGKSYWVSDGFQRVAAAEIAGAAEIYAEVHIGTLSDALWDSYAANTAHGMRYTAAETQNIVRFALQHPKSATFSNVQIAEHLHISEATVRRWRERLSSSRDEDDGVRIVSRGHTTYRLRTANIGQKRDKHQAKSRKELRDGLLEMKDKASIDVRRVLNAIGTWMFGRASAEECLRALEKILARQGSCTRDLHC